MATFAMFPIQINCSMMQPLATRSKYTVLPVWMCSCTGGCQLRYSTIWPVLVCVCGCHRHLPPVRRRQPGIPPPSPCSSLAWQSSTRESGLTRPRGPTMWRSKHRWSSEKWLKYWGQMAYLGASLWLVGPTLFLGYTQLACSYTPLQPHSSAHSNRPSPPIPYPHSHTPLFRYSQSPFPVSLLKLFPNSGTP